MCRLKPHWRPLGPTHRRGILQAVNQPAAPLARLDQMRPVAYCALVRVLKYALWRQCGQVSLIGLLRTCCVRTAGLLRCRVAPGHGVDEVVWAVVGASG